MIDSLDLTIADGEFLVLLGPSGCGKSTLLKIIAGLEDATDGEVYIDGQLANYTAPKRAMSRWSSRTTRSIRT